jgi:tetratricopeptide (TPR) repeat protein
MASLLASLRLSALLLRLPRKLLFSERCNPFHSLLAGCLSSIEMHLCIALAPLFLVAFFKLFNALRFSRCASRGPNVVFLRIKVALYMKDRGHFTEAEILYQQVLSTTERTLGPEYPDPLIARHNLAVIYADQGKHEQAENIYQQILSSYEQALGS